MFEKDAEKIANEKLCATTMCYNHCNFNSPKHHRCGEWHRCYEIAKDSAEFGYNKANEWHYVKDGDLPKDEKDVQVLYQDCDKVNSYTCLYDIHNESWSYYNLDECLLKPFDYKVIAWKEILPPKESNK